MRSEGCRMCVNWIWSSHQWKKWIKMFVETSFANTKWCEFEVGCLAYAIQKCSMQNTANAICDNLWNCALEIKSDRDALKGKSITCARLLTIKATKFVLCNEQQACLLIWFRRFPQRHEPSIKINFSFPCAQLSPIEFALDWQQLELWQFRETKCQNWLLVTSKSSERFRGFISANTPRSRPSSWVWEVNLIQIRWGMPSTWVLMCF